VLHVLAAGLHQFGQFFMALAQQHVDVRPGLADAMLQTHQTVVEDHPIGGDEEQHHQHNHHTQAHPFLQAVPERQHSIGSCVTR